MKAVATKNVLVAISAIDRSTNVLAKVEIEEIECL